MHAAGPLHAEAELLMCPGHQCVAHGPGLPCTVAYLTVIYAFAAERA